MQPTSVARVLRPAVAGREAARSGPPLRIDAALTLVAGRDHVPSEDIASALTPDGALSSTVWLRLERLDTDPSCLAESLVKAAGFAGMLGIDRAGEIAPGTACGSPGEVGRHLARILRPDATLVVEDDEGCGDTSSIVSAVRTYTEHAGEGARAIYVCHQALPTGLTAQVDTVLDRTQPPASLVTTIDFDSGCTAEALGRLSEMVGPRSALIRDILDATELRDHQLLTHLAGGRTHRRTLLRRINARLISQISPAEVQALTIAAHGGYWHPSLSDRTPPDGMTLRPWMVPLEREWWWLRPMWRRSLVRSLDLPAPTARHRLLGRLRRSTVRDGASVAAAAPAPGRPAVAATGAAPPRAASTEPCSGVAATMFGAFELRIDGVEVPRWHGRLGPSILAFLLLQRRCVARDRLLDVFWPDVEPRTAQNRLRVAVSSLRRSLEVASPRPVIEFTNGNYRVNRDGEVTLDIDEFERYAAAGRRAEESNDTAGALRAYHRALELYRDELLTELPYEEWTMLPREALRVAYLDCLSNASCLHLRRREHSAALNLAWRILDADPAREDAHRLIMRCHAAQGCLHQVRRQFDLCRHELITVLGVEPTLDTVELMRSLEADRTEGSAPY